MLENDYNDFSFYQWSKKSSLGKNIVFVEVLVDDQSVLPVCDVMFGVILSPSPDSYLKKMLISKNMLRRKARKKRG